MEDRDLIEVRAKELMAGKDAKRIVVVVGVRGVRPYRCFCFMARQLDVF